MRRTGLCADIEVPVYYHAIDPENGARMDVRVSKPGVQNSDELIDVQVTSPFCVEAAGSVGKAASIAESKKRTKYRLAVVTQPSSIPMGEWVSTLKAFLSGIAPEEARATWLQDAMRRISCVLQIHNARILLRTPLLTWRDISGALSPVHGFVLVSPKCQLVVVVGVLFAPTYAQPGYCVDVGSRVLPLPPPLDRSCSKQQHVMPRGPMCVRQCVASLPASRPLGDAGVETEMAYRIAVNCAPVLPYHNDVPYCGRGSRALLHLPPLSLCSSKQQRDPGASGNSSQVAQVVPRSWYLASSLWVTQTLRLSPLSHATGVVAFFDCSPPGVVSVALRPWILASRLRVTLASKG